MLLTRSLPPHFLLPAWGTRQLLGALQRAHQSTSTESEPPTPTSGHFEDDRSHESTPLIRHFTSYKGSGKPSERKEWIAARRAHRKQHNLKSSLLEDEPSYKDYRMMRRIKGKKEPIRRAPFGPPGSGTRSILLEEAESMSSIDEQAHNGTSNIHIERVESTSPGVKRAHIGAYYEIPPIVRSHKGRIEEWVPPEPTISLFNGPNGTQSKPLQRIRTQSTLNEQAGSGTHAIPLERGQPTNSPLDDEGTRKSTRSVQPERTPPTSSLEGQAHNGTRAVPLEGMQTTSLLSGDKRPSRGALSARPERTKPTGSLFDELFPEESKAAKQREKKTVDKLPMFEWHDGPKIDWRETVEKAAEKRKNWFHTIPESKVHTPHIEAEENRRKRDLSVLVLSSASKTLEESDFFRLGEKGQHIEGWTSGIVKVIQARDSQTLEPLGHYFLVFSNKAAASAYLDQMIRLHALSRTHSGRESPIPLPSKFLRPGEDVKTVLRGFSMVPGQSKLSLRLINRPHSPAVAQVLSDGGPAAIARQKTNSEDMVLFSVDLGHITYWDVKNAISDDGKKRNLHWKLTEGEGAVVKINGSQWNEEDDLSDESRHSRSDRRHIRGPPKFILSFKDSHEARRFVREWHRRPFPVQKDHKLGDEPPPVINAQMFW